jgi:HAD superfamily hydrolase (TIGR01458 family)
MRAVLIDLDGVVYEGERVVEGAPTAIQWLQSRRIPCLFVTNTTSRPRAALVSKLAGMGIQIRASDILTPPLAATHWLARFAPGSAALFVPAATRDDFAGLTQLPEAVDEGAASVVIGDLGEGWAFATLNRAFRLLMANPDARLVALGLTRYWRAAEGLRLDVGPFVKALEYASGRDAVVLGKPSAAFFETALESLGVTPAQAVMIGDDIVGDVQGAQGAGIPGVLVRTGKFRESDLARGIQPNAVLGSIAELPAWWAGHH